MLEIVFFLLTLSYQCMIRKVLLRGPIFEIKLLQISNILRSPSIRNSCFLWLACVCAGICLCVCVCVCFIQNSCIQWLVCVSMHTCVCLSVCVYLLSTELVNKLHQEETKFRIPEKTSYKNAI